MIIQIRKNTAFVYFILLTSLIMRCKFNDNSIQTAITEPTAKDIFIAGDTITIKWSEPMDCPVLSYRYRKSDRWDSLKVLDITNKSAHVILPDTWYSDSFQIELQDRSGQMKPSVSDYFKVKFIKLYPFDRDTFFTGDTVQIKWRHSSLKFSAIRIRLSVNDCKQFNELLSNGLLSTETGYQWVVGQEASGYPFGYPSNKCVIQVRDYSYDYYSDCSKTFSIHRREE